MRVLYLDIETSPIEAYTWGLWQQNVAINQIIKPTQMLSFAAKWRGKKNKLFFSTHHNGQAEMREAAHNLLDEADVLVTFNGLKFDVPHLKREFVEAGMTPPSPWKDLDLCNVVKRQFRFPSNKLQYVSTALGLDGKVQHSGFSLWTDCLAGDEKAWAQMRKYNIQDVVLLEELHDRIMPYIHNHPHYGLHTDPDKQTCARCGSTKLQRRGWAYTGLGKYRRYQCTGCGGWSRGKKAVDMVDVRGIQ